MNVTAKFDGAAIDQKLKNLHRQIYKELRVDLRSAGRKIINRSGREFQQNFGSSKNPEVSKVLGAIKSMGINVNTTDAGQTMILNIGSISQLDSLTRLPPAKATGNIFNFWRILHEGAGMRAYDGKPKLDKFFGNKPKRTSPYPIRAIVQTSIFDQWPAGLYPPYLELQTLAKTSSQVIILRHRGSEGHRWFVTNSGVIFQEDERNINHAMNLSISRAIKKVGLNR